MNAMKIPNLCLLTIALLLGWSAKPALAVMPISTNGLDANETATALALDKQPTTIQIVITPIPPFIPVPVTSPSPLEAAIEALPAGGQAAALDQLSPEKFGVFTSSVAFNNASFETIAMDTYLDSLRQGPGGTFADGSGGIDTSGLSANDPDVDPALGLVHSRMLAWSAAPDSAGLLSDSTSSAMAGTDMKESKDMKAAETPSYTDPWHFFVRGNVVLAQGFSNQDVPHFDDNTSSVVLGTDYRLTPNFLIGLTASFAHTDATLDDNGSSATVDSYSPGLYASYADGGWYANLIGDYLHNAYTQSRVIGFLGQTATSAPEGNEGVVDADGGYDFHVGALSVGPLLGLQYTHLTVNGYGEGGSIANLSVGEDQSNSLRSRLGAHIEYPLSHWGMTFTPHLEAAWQHEFMDQDRGITSAFAGGGGDFTVRTPHVSPDAALVDAGVNVDINRTISVFTEYLVQTGQENYFGQSVQAGVKIGF
jgi:uncharacterized protein YhjY with autotransporter beta-barrel domain